MTTHARAVKKNINNMSAAVVVEPDSSTAHLTVSLTTYIKSLAVVFFDNAVGTSAALDKALRDDAAALTSFCSDAKHTTLSVQYVPGTTTSDGSPPPSATAAPAAAAAVTAAPAPTASAIGASAAAASAASAPRVSVQLEVQFVDARAHCVVLIKRAADGILVSKNAQQRDVALASQLQVVNLPPGSPLESLHACIHGSLAPFFNSFMRVNESSRKDTASNAGSLLRLGDNDS